MLEVWVTMAGLIQAHKESVMAVDVPMSVNRLKLSGTVDSQCGPDQLS